MRSRRAILLCPGGSRGELFMIKGYAISMFSRRPKLGLDIGCQEIRRFAIVEKSDLSTDLAGGRAFQIFSSVSSFLVR